MRWIAAAARTERRAERTGSRPFEPPLTVSDVRAHDLSQLAQPRTSVNRLRNSRRSDKSGRAGKPGEQQAESRNRHVAPLFSFETDQFL